MKDDDKCRVEFAKRRLEVKGPCAQGLQETFDFMFEASRGTNAEISAFICVNPDTHLIDSVVLEKVGTPTQTSLAHERVCPVGDVQISMHTHPVSGEPKFSVTDAIAITSRMNEGIDNASCVVGSEATQCLFSSLIWKVGDSDLRNP